VEEEDVDFLLLEIQTNCKNWVWKENQLRPQLCLHLLGPTRQATLVELERAMDN
jgi:hypothetical protein